MKKLVFILLILFSLIGFSQIDNVHLNVGDSAPLISGIDQFDKVIKSSEILKDKEILLLFYRGNWCPYCRKHLKTLQENLEELTNKGYYVIVVSPEKPEKTQETSDKVKATFSIIHDVDNTIMKAYKVAFEINEATVKNYYNFTKNKVEKYNREDNNTLPVPATYIIGKDGNIAFVHYDPDYTNRKDIKEILSMK